MGCSGGCGKSKVEILANKVRSIAIGWSNVVWPNPETEKLAYKRIEVCAECERNVRGLCTDCGCWIPAKARSPEETCKYWKQ